MSDLSKNFETLQLHAGYVLLLLVLLLLSPKPTPDEVRETDTAAGRSRTRRPIPGLSPSTPRP
jgi:hypothetical protein